MRLPDWEHRLHLLVEGNIGRRYEFGRWDCLLWPAAAVKAVTGEDFGRGHRGRYRSLATAYRYLQSRGHESPEAMLDALFEPKPIGFAQRGDLVLVLTQAGNNPGVCMGDFVFVVGEDGLLRAPRDLWIRAWAVGDHHSDIPKGRHV